MGEWLSFGGSIIGFDGATLGFVESASRGIRLCFGDTRYDPTMVAGWKDGVEWVRVSSEPNVWDCLFASTSWEGLFCDSDGYGGRFNDRQNNPVTVIGADSSHVTDMGSMFMDCTGLVAVNLFDTGSVTDMGEMFSNCTGITGLPSFDTRNVQDFGGFCNGCHSLVHAPTIDTSSAIDISEMFYGCTSLNEVPSYNVASVKNAFRAFYGCIGVTTGTLSLYNRLSSAEVPSHAYCFKDCGAGTVYGREELEQIPQGWK